MAPRKFDTVVEAVRFSHQGLISMVRVYERRGPTFSDRILLDRETLVQHLKQKKRFVAGRRIPQMAGTFDVGASLKLVSRNGEEFITTGEASDEDPGAAVQDRLDGVPLF
jgi:hypothetical protein